MHVQSSTNESMNASKRGNQEMRMNIQFPDEIVGMRKRGREEERERERERERESECE